MMDWILGKGTEEQYWKSKRVKWNNPVELQKLPGCHNESSRTRHSNGTRGGVKDSTTNTGMRRRGQSETDRDRDRDRY